MFHSHSLTRAVGSFLLVANKQRASASIAFPESFPVETLLLFWENPTITDRTCTLQLETYRQLEFALCSSQPYLPRSDLLPFVQNVLRSWLPCMHNFDERSTDTDLQIYDANVSYGILEKRHKYLLTDLHIGRN
jgi:hypothetical protein